jgi:hypothetical protein
VELSVMAAEAHARPRLVTARMNHMASRADPSRARVRGQTGASKSRWEPSTGAPRGWRAGRAGPVPRAQGSLAVPRLAV